MYEIPQSDYNAIKALLEQNIQPRYIFIEHKYPLEWACQVEAELKALEQPEQPIE